MTEIEAGYVAQGYELPAHLTWDAVAAARQQNGIDEIYVPVAFGPGVAAWGTPMIDGKFLTHP